MDAPVTRPSLLLRIQDPQDDDAWNQFLNLYGSVIYGFARKKGLQDADAADVMQEVLRAVSNSSRRFQYDPSKGSFRSWLLTVTRNKIWNHLDKRRNHLPGTGDTVTQLKLEEHPLSVDEQDTWDQEYEQRAFLWAADRVRNEFQEATWKAFWLSAIEGLQAKQVGQQLGMSPGAVYVAKSRVIARLREQIELLQT